MLDDNFFENGKRWRFSEVSMLRVDAFLETLQVLTVIINDSRYEIRRTIYEATST
jgi:hypothetical protein